MINKLLFICTITVTLINVSYVNIACAEYSSDELQKLFTDKEQRKKIDAVRFGGVKEPKAQQSKKVKVSGYMTRSDGKSVVWINNENTLDSSVIDDIKVNQKNIGKNKAVVVSVDGKSKKLKPGEVWFSNTNKVVESN